MQQRVYCLYRVSTAKQVNYTDTNQADIPVQRKACQDFAEKMDDHSRRTGSRCVRL